VTVASESGFVYVVDTATRRQSGAPLSAGGTGLQGLAVSADGSQIAALGGDGAVRLWDRPTSRAVGPPLAGHATSAMAMEFSADGRLVTGGFDQQLISWDLRPDSWVAQACRIVGRDLTEAEWQLYLQERAYRKTCSS
jgi:WD40 repeat protein